MGNGAREEVPEFSQLSELRLQTAEDMLPYTTENIFSSTDLLKNNSENLSGPIFAAQAVRRPSGLSTKRRKARKVLYPAHVRKYLPRQKKDPVKRWLLFCAGIILIQVLIEAPEQERLPGGQSPTEKLPCAAAASPPGAAGLAQNRSREHPAPAGAISESTQLLQKPSQHPAPAGTISESTQLLQEPSQRAPSSCRSHLSTQLLQEPSQRAPSSCRNHLSTQLLQEPSQRALSSCRNHLREHPAPAGTISAPSSCRSHHSTQLLQEPSQHPAPAGTISESTQLLQEPSQRAPSSCRNHLSTQLLQEPSQRALSSCRNHLREHSAPAGTISESTQLLQEPSQRALSSCRNHHITQLLQEPSQRAPSSCRNHLRQHSLLQEPSQRALTAAGTI
ncbi:unnamed protein product [Coccothraustes coccothraustes]